MSFLRRLPPLFYLGLFPVICVLWLWADSREHATHWNWTPRGQEIHVLIATDSLLHYTHSTVSGWEPGVTPDPNRRPWGSSGAFGNFARTPTISAIFGGSDSLFPLPFSNSGNAPLLDMEITSWELGLPFWLILLAWLPLWLGLAWWQARRRRKMLQASVAIAGDREIAG